MSSIASLLSKYKGRKTGTSLSSNNNTNNNTNKNPGIAEFRYVDVIVKKKIIRIN